MEKNNLKLMWKAINAGNSFDEKKNIEEIIRKKHSKAIAETLYGQKLKCGVYACVLVVFVALMTYAFGYLGLHLSFSSIVPLALAGLFLFIKTILECSRLWILVGRWDDQPLKESSRLFLQRLERIKMIDFLLALVYCYGWAIAIIRILIRDYEGLKGLSVFVMILILLLLLIPWLIRYQHNKRYEDMYINLNQSTDFFNNYF